MKLSRRSAASLLAGIQFAGGKAAKTLAESSGAMLSGAGQSVGYAETAYQGQPANMPQGPRMPEWQAAKLALRNPEICELLVAAAQAQCRVVLSVDPDIEVYRSFSPMAKITFQRQRNVQRLLDQHTEEPLWSITQKAQEFIKKLV